jgi:hypothetical protein
MRKGEIERNKQRKRRKEGRKEGRKEENDSENIEAKTIGVRQAGKQASLDSRLLRKFCYKDCVDQQKSGAIL